MFKDLAHKRRWTNKFIKNTSSVIILVSPEIVVIRALNDKLRHGEACEMIRCQIWRLFSFTQNKYRCSSVYSFFKKIGLRKNEFSSPDVSFFKSHRRFFGLPICFQKSPKGDKRKPTFLVHLGSSTFFVMNTYLLGVDDFSWSNVRS